MVDELINRLNSLSKEKQLLFGLLAAERFFDCYKIFNRREKFGNVVLLLEAMGLIERSILGEEIDKNIIEKYKVLVDESTPDIDDFGSINSSLALNVSAIIYEALNLELNFEERIPEEFSTYCTDSIHFLVLEIENYDSKDFDKISNHRLMREELSIQNGIVSYLEKIENVEAGDVDTLRQMQIDIEFNKLNLEEIFDE